ncbi:MAG: hypothetical protein ACI37P_00585 [Eggerthellaceae bacterium]
MPITNGIKIATISLPAKAISEIRKTTGLAISEIKQRAQDNDYLIEEDLSDDRSLRKMIDLSKKLNSLGIKVDFYQGGHNRSLEFMENVYESHRETARALGLED